MSKVLLVIDMLNDFIDPAGSLYCGEAARKIIAPIEKRVSDYVKNSEPVIFICDAHAEDDLEFKQFPPHALKASWGAKVIPELLKLSDGKGKFCFVKKQRYSGFYGTDLEKMLGHIAEEQRKNLLELQVEVVGVCTNICVLYTVEELRNRNMETIVWAEEVASFDSSAHALALEQMRTVLGALIR